MQGGRVELSTRPTGTERLSAGRCLFGATTGGPARPGRGRPLGVEALDGKGIAGVGVPFWGLRLFCFRVPAFLEEIFSRVPGGEAAEDFVPVLRWRFCVGGRRKPPAKSGDLETKRVGTF